MRGDCWGTWLIMLGFMDLGWPRVCRRSASVLLYTPSGWGETIAFQYAISMQSLNNCIVYIYIYDCIDHQCGFMVLLKSHIDGVVQDCPISTANALEILQSCTKASIFYSLCVFARLLVFAIITNQRSSHWVNVAILNVRTYGSRV